MENIGESPSPFVDMFRLIAGSHLSFENDGKIHLTKTDRGTRERKQSKMQNLHVFLNISTYGNNPPSAVVFTNSDANLSSDVLSWILSNFKNQ